MYNLGVELLPWNVALTGIAYALYIGLFLCIGVPVIWFAAIIGIELYHGGPMVISPVVALIVYICIMDAKVIWRLRVILYWDWGKIWGLSIVGGIVVVLLAIMISGAITRALE